MAELWEETFAKNTIVEATNSITAANVAIAAPFKKRSSAPIVMETARCTIPPTERSRAAFYLLTDTVTVALG